MLESETSGAPSGSADTAPPPAAFGARGSGLARGKRPAAPAPATATASNGEYRPTAIEVIAAKSDYKNPFVETAPAAPVDEVKPTPAAESPAPTASVETKSIQPTVFAVVQPVASAPVQPAAKPQLNILPAEEPKRTELSWEAGSPDAPAKTNVRPRREERPVFRAERPEKNPFEPREQKPFEPREQKPFESREQKPFQPRESREPRREPAFEPREQRPKPAAEAAPKKSGGFFGWLKSLFGGSEPAATNGTSPPASEPARNGESRQNRRRHRGGRGGQGGHYRQGDPSRGEGNRGGFRNGQPQSEGRRESNGEHREGGQGDGGQRRRRRRGGRGGQGGHYRQGDPSRGESSNGGPQGS
jgi:hypothetical protein